MTTDQDPHAVCRIGLPLELVHCTPLAHGLTARIYRRPKPPRWVPPPPDDNPPHWLSYEEPAS